MTMTNNFNAEQYAYMVKEMHAHKEGNALETGRYL